VADAEPGPPRANRAAALGRCSRIQRCAAADAARERPSPEQFLKPVAATGLMADEAKKREQAVAHVVSVISLRSELPGHNGLSRLSGEV
jgi:hypothetical protein